MNLEGESELFKCPHYDRQTTPTISQSPFNNPIAILKLDRQTTSIEILIAILKPDRHPKSWSLLTISNAITNTSFIQSPLDKKKGKPLGSAKWGFDIVVREVEFDGGR